MKGNELSRREFLQAGAGAAAAVLSASIIGCSGGGSGGAVFIPDNSAVKAWSYHGQRGITAVYQPADSSLYRRLLPEAFQMPDSPMLIVTVVSYYDVTSPLVPYHEGFAMIACKYQGQTCLYTLTMPVDDKTANDGGIFLGFPKYVADKIDLAESGGVWNGQVTHQGRTVMRMTFTPQGETEKYNTNNPGISCINLVPPGVGPQIQSVNTTGQQIISRRIGSASLTVDPGESWGKLLEGATPVTAQFEEITGNWTLTPGNDLKTAVVSIARIKNGRVDLAVEEAIDLLGGVSQVTLGKQKIMLKPNLVAESRISTTNPEVIRALALLLQGAGKEVTIGEGSACATGYNLIDGEVYRTKNQKILNEMQQYVFSTLGYDSLGIPLVNLHTGELTKVTVPNGFVFNEITIHKSLTEIDMLCSVPIMKTHMLGGVTLGMKNLIGTYPGSVYGSVRSLVHDQAASVEGSGVAAAVVDIVRANKLGLVVVDASTAMEGNGPSNGTPVKMDLIIAGTNPLATDMVTANIMGFQPAEIPTFQWANKAGMGPQKLGQIEVRGETIASVQRNFVRPQITPWSTARSTFGYKEIT